MDIKDLIKNTKIDHKEIEEPGIIKSKKQLKQDLNRNKVILKPEMIDYLNSLIELEFSVIKDNISKQERDCLSELKLYKEIARYNILKGAEKLFNEKNMNPDSFGYGEGRKFFTGSGNKKIDLIDIDFTEIKKVGWWHERPSIPTDFKTLNIGKITLFQTVENKDYINAKIQKLQEEIKSLEKATCPYPVDHRIGGASSVWYLDNQNKIIEKEEEIEELQMEVEISLTPTEQTELKKAQELYQQFLEDYGLTSVLDSKSKKTKRLIKSLPNLKVENEIKYI